MLADFSIRHYADHRVALLNLESSAMLKEDTEFSLTAKPNEVLKLFDRATAESVKVNQVVDSTGFKSGMSSFELIHTYYGCKYKLTIKLPHIAITLHGVNDYHRMWLTFEVI